MAKPNTMIPTRFNDGVNKLFYSHQVGTQVGRWKNGRRLRHRQVSFWRFFLQNEGDEEPVSVGPEYPNRAELLADLNRYATEICGF